MMIKQTNFSLHSNQSGQAMTEFVVSVSFVFLSLFVIVPMFGKLMDLQYQTQQASRYMAWERTVWFAHNKDDDGENNEKIISNAYWQSVAIRSDTGVIGSMQTRFFESSGPAGLKPILAEDVSASRSDPNPIWTYVQSKKPMYGGTLVSSGKDSETGRNMSLDGQQTPGIGYKIVDVINDGVKIIADPVNSFLGALGGSNEDFIEFAYEVDNYYSPVITTHITKENSHGFTDDTKGRDRRSDGTWTSGIEDVLFSSGWDGTLTARSAILADGWNTQSLEHYQERANDFVPSTVFDNALFDAAITVASVLDGGPGNSAIEKLEFGAVGIEPMPSEDGKPLDVSETGGLDGGFYYYDD